MNIPLIAGGVGALAGITAGVVAERATHVGLEQRKEVHAFREAQAQDWIDGANRTFGDEIVADRTRKRELDARLEDYKIANPAPDGVSYGRNQRWHEGVSISEPDRDVLWGATWFGGLLGGGLGGGAVLGVNHGSSVTGAAIGAAILGAGVGSAAGAMVSNWMH